jgi:hypothetical protein
METTPLDMRSSLNTQESTISEVQPGGNSHFADMLGQKISEATLSVSTSDPSTAARGGNHTPTVVTGMIPSGKDESAAGGKATTVADLHTRSLKFKSEPLDGIAGEIDSLAGATGEESPSPTEKMQPVEEAETAILDAKEMMEYAIALPVAGGSIPHADPIPPESAAGRIAAPSLPNAALFAQAGQHREATHLEIDKDASPAEKTVRKGSPAPAPHEPLSLSDPHADHHSGPEGDERGTETKFLQQAAEAQQRKNGRSAADTSFDLHEPTPSPYDYGKREEALKEGASIAATAQKTIAAAYERELASERGTPAGSPEKARTAGDVIVEAAGRSVRDHQQRNTTASHAGRDSERDIFPFRMEMTNIAALQETNTPAPAGTAGIEMQAVIDQLLEARQAAGNDSGRIRILLNPPNLGTVDLDIVVRGQRVEVVMTAETATVQQALQSRGDDIRIALQRQDLKIEGFQVLLQDNGTGQQQTQGGETFGNDRAHRERFNAGEDTLPVPPVFSPITGATSDAGRVSIFA